MAAKSSLVCMRDLSRYRHAHHSPNSRRSQKYCIKRDRSPFEKKADKVIAQNETIAAIAEAQELERQNLTLNEMFNDWIVKGVARQDGNQEIQRLFNKDVLSKVGSMPVKDIKESDILNVYRGILERGTQVNPRFRFLVKLAADMRQLFKWAEARQSWRALLIEGNPALLANEKILLDVNSTEERDRILTPTEIAELDRLIKFEAQTYIEAVNKSNAN